MLKRAGNLLFTLVVIGLILIPLATFLRGKPTLAVTIRSWSMTPLMTRGDMVFILPTHERTNFSTGQIVIFQSPENGIREWVIHRVIEGDRERGFITKGDANEKDDQEGMRYPPIRPEWIAGIVPTIGALPLKIPLLGYIPLLVEQNLRNARLVPMLLGILALALFLDEIMRPKRKQKKEDNLQKGLLYFSAGLAFAVLMGSLMLMGSLFLTLPYAVEKSAGVLMGSDIGVLEIGSSRELVLAELENKGATPVYYHVVSRDPQVVVLEEQFYMRGGKSAQVNATVHGQKEGVYRSNIIVGMFMPFLPLGVIRFLARTNFWLALIVVSLIPALPLFIMPYLDSRYRHRFARELRKKWMRALRHLPF